MEFCGEALDYPSHVDRETTLEDRKLQVIFTEVWIIKREIIDWFVSDVVNNVIEIFCNLNLRQGVHFGCTCRLICQDSCHQKA